MLLASSTSAVSRFERQPGQVRSLTFLDAPDYWMQARRSAGLTLVDASYQSAAIPLVAPNMDGVILTFFTITVAAAEVAVGLAILVALYRKRKSLLLHDLNLLGR